MESFICLELFETISVTFFLIRTIKEFKMGQKYF